MGEVTDPRLLQQLNGGRPPAGPGFPTAGNPAKVREQQRQESQLGLDYEANRRADEARKEAEERLRIALEAAKVDQATADANLGVTTRESQDRAALHATNLLVDLAIVNDVRNKEPTAIKPSWLEKGVSMATEDPDFQAWSRSPQRQRVGAAYKNIIQSVLNMKTGAAYNQEEIKGQVASLVPGLFDSPELLADKRLRLQAQIEAARAEAGPSNLKVIKALDALQPYLDTMYSPSGVSNIREASEGAKFLSNDTAVTPLPPEMQKEHADFLAANPPGKLTTQGYLDFRKALQEKYDFNTPVDPEQAQTFVDAYNEGRPVTQELTPEAHKMEGLESLAATAANSPLGTGAMNYANAMSLGIPELLAGREGRAAKEVADEENWKSALTGEILGSIAPSVALEKGLLKAGERIVTGSADSKAGKLLADLGANGIYGGVRGYNSSETEDGLSGALEGFGYGAGGALVGRGLVKGATGFQSSERIGKIAALRDPQTFDMPAERIPLEADEITPARFQSMTDDQLREELAAAKRGMEMHDRAQELRKGISNQFEELQARAKAVAQDNRRKQELFVKENSRSYMSPEQAEALRVRTEELFPTNYVEVLKTPEFVKYLENLRIPDTKGMPSRDMLEQRAARLEQYLGQDPTPKQGKIPGVDMTTMQRAGLGDTEEALSGFPVVHGAREAANASWNRQNSARVLARIGVELPKDIKPGFEANAFVNQQLNEGYNKLRPSIRGRVDDGFNTAVAALKVAAPQDAAGKDAWAKIEQTLAAFRKPDGTFDGEGYKKLSEALRGFQKDWGLAEGELNSSSLRDMARTAERVRRQAQALVSRSNPAAGKKLKQLEAAWAHQMRIEAASLGPSKASGGIYGPETYLNKIEKLDTSKNKGAVARGQGFDQNYANTAMELMGSKPAKRTSLVQTGIGLHILGDATKAAVAAGGMAYTPGLKRVTQAIVDGKFGSTVNQVTKNLPDNSPFKDLPADVMKAAIAQALRAAAMQKGQ